MCARACVMLLGCLAFAQGGCGGQTVRAASYSCGYMKDTVGAFRQQARLIVDREGFKTSALSIEDGVLDVELLLRDACRNAPDGDRPYARVAHAAPSD
jgi:hypothetical protein